MKPLPPIPSTPQTRKTLWRNRGGSGRVGQILTYHWPAMTRKPFFWLMLGMGSGLALLFSWLFFEQAFPTLNLSVSMSREQAQSGARQRAHALQLAPDDALSTVRFYQHSEAQTFIELEAGGSAMLQQLESRHIFPLRQWEVRFYKEGDAAHTTLYFTPQGQPHGFMRHVPEQQKGAALAVADARRLAEQKARDDWQTDLAPGRGPWALVQQSLKTRPNGRIDHFFVYERGDIRLGKQGEGRVRLQLQVAGDQFAELHHEIKVPESFSRRHEEMRAANNTIASAASLAFGLLYGVGGCMLGALLLWRQGWIVSRPALLWASLIALLQGAAALNQIPGSWFHYDSALGTRDFIMQQVGVAIFGMAVNWLVLAFSFMAAESLSRKAFGHFPQFWRIWSADALASKQVLGQTVGAYLWVGFDLAFITAFYYVTRHWLGWWSPMEALIDPDVLATPLPFLSPLANALHAGFWEECLFRAVPLAGAALLGDFLHQHYHGRFGTRRGWIVLALVLQAVIFGAAHANYAQQPAFARPLELFFPALVWGLVYLRYGLLPGIVFHYVFDLLLMSLPIFVTRAEGLTADRVIIIVCALVPLALVLWQRWRAGRWQELPAKLLNNAWQAQLPALEEAPSAPTAQANRAIWQRVQRVLPLLAAGGLLCVVLLPNPAPPALPFNLLRSNAEQAADAELAARGIRLGANWQRFAQVASPAGEGEQFIWKNAGSAAWQRLRGHYLPPAVWRVRYVHFDGDVAQRAEEWVVNIEDGVDGRGGGAHVRGITHVLPEARRASTTSEQEARTLAQQALLARFGSLANGWREISAQEIKQPQRKDWQFTFADDAASPLKNGEARIEVTLAGAEVTRIRRTVHEPEEWQRQQRARGALMQTVRIVMALLLLALLIGSSIMALKQKQGVKVARRPAMVVGLLMLVLLLAERANNWQALGMALKTELPLATQLGTTGVGVLIGALVIAALCALLLNFGQQLAASGKLGNSGKSPWGPGLALALALFGVQTAFARLLPAEMPPSYRLDLLNDAVPALSEIKEALLHVLLFGNLLALVLGQLHDFNANFRRRQLPTILILLLAGLTMALKQDEVSQFLLQGLGFGLLLSLLYLLVARFEPRVLLVALIGTLALRHVWQSLNSPWDASPHYAVVYVLTLVVVTRHWLALLKPRPQA